MKHPSKSGINKRRKSALALLEKRLEAFKKEGKDKEPWTSHGGTKLHKGRTFAEECARLNNEISNLKKKIQL